MWIHWVWFMYVSLPLAAQLQCRRHRFNFWIRKILWRRDRLPTPVFLSFLGGSDSKESSLTTQDTWVRSLGLEYLLDEGMATHSIILAWRIPMDRGAWQATVHGVSHDWVTKHTGCAFYHVQQVDSYFRQSEKQKHHIINGNICQLRTFIFAHFRQFL